MRLSYCYDVVITSLFFGQILDQVLPTKIASYVQKNVLHPIIASYEMGAWIELLMLATDYSNINVNNQIGSKLYKNSVFEFCKIAGLLLYLEKDMFFSEKGSWKQIGQKSLELLPKLLLKSFLSSFICSYEHFNEIKINTAEKHFIIEVSFMLLKKLAMGGAINYREAVIDYARELFTMSDYIKHFIADDQAFPYAVDKVINENLNQFNISWLYENLNISDWVENNFSNMPKSIIIDFGWSTTETISPLEPQEYHAYYESL